MKTLSTKNLFVIFAALATVSTLLYFFAGKNDSGNFNTTEINLDPAKIDQWIVIPQQKPEKAYRLFKEGRKWRIELPDKLLADADMEIVARAIHHFVNLKPESLVGTTKKEWRQFGVDTAGTLVQVFESRQEKYDFIIGNLIFQNDKLATYYFRLKNEDNVYTVHNYLDGSIRNSAENFRKKDLLIANPEEIQSLTFNYAATQPFTLSNEAGEWKLYGQLVDSLKINPYLRLVTKFRLTDFTQKPVTAPSYSITVASAKNKETVIINAYPLPAGKWALTSSANDGNYFAADSNKVKRYFPSKRNFQ